MPSSRVLPKAEVVITKLEAKKLGKAAQKVKESIHQTVDQPAPIVGGFSHKPFDSIPKRF